MEVTINGNTHHLDKPCTVQDLIEYLDIATKRFAIEINKELIPRSSFATHPIQNGDKIEVVGAIGGG